MAGGIIFDKHLTIGNILVTLTIAVGGVSAWFKMENRIELLEQKDAMRTEMVSELKSDIRALNLKVDKILIEITRNSR